MKLAALYVANLKVALRSLVVLLAALLALIGLVLISLPQGLFSSNDIPKISLAVVYGDGSHNDELSRNLSAELDNIEVLDQVSLTTLDVAQGRMAQGEVDAIIILPDDMLDVLVYGGHTVITVQSNNGLIGSVVYSVGEHAVKSLDEIQSYALIYQQEALTHISDPDQRSKAVNSFYMVLLSEAMMRMDNVQNPSTVSPYYVHVLTLLLFLAVSIASFFVAVISARHYATGYIRHLYTKGVRFRHLFAAQILAAATISLVLGIILALLLRFITSELNVFALLASCVLLSVVLTALYLMFSGFKQQPQAATTRTLIGSLALMFFMLFAGGGFYPTGLMQSSLRLFNPTWLASQLAQWSLGGPLSPLQLALFAVPLAAAGAIGYLEWRRSL